MEIWRDIFGWEGLYQISNLGRVKSLAGSFLALRKGKPAMVRKPERILKTPLTAGYPSVALCRNGKQTLTYVHRLVCEAWHGAPETGEEVAHCDGVKTNNIPDNLRWATRHENLLDKVKHGTQLRHEQVWCAKIPEREVTKIKLDSVSRTAELATHYRVSESLIRGIRRGSKRSKPMLKKVA